SVQGSDGGVGFIIILHLDESEALGLAGEPVHDDLCVRHLAILTKKLFQLVFRGAIWKTSHINAFRHVSRSCSDGPPRPALPQTGGRRSQTGWGSIESKPGRTMQWTGKYAARKHLASRPAALSAHGQWITVTQPHACKR